MTFWCVWNYDQSRAFHWMLTAYWAVMALIHWFHVARPSVSIVGGLINTVPLALFLAIGVLRTTTEGRPEGMPEASFASERTVQEQHV